MTQMPGGGEFGRSARREVRNPVLRLPASREIMDRPVEERRPLGTLLRQLSKQCQAEAERSWHSNKAIMAAYWKACAVYSKHLAHVVDPR